MRLPFLLLLVACKGGGAANAECHDHADCTGDLEACVEERCVEVDCLSSESCAIEQYCDDEDGFVCKDGCADDSDCLAGDECDTENNECESYECRDTQLDCEIGEVCDEDDGECVEADGEHCTACDPFFPDCGNSADCWVFDENTLESYCLEQCDPGDEDTCPRGFTCQDITGAGDFGCAAWCPTLIENGWL